MYLYMGFHFSSHKQVIFTYLISYEHMYFHNKEKDALNSRRSYEGLVGKRKGKEEVK